VKSGKSSLQFRRIELEESEFDEDGVVFRLVDDDADNNVIFCHAILLLSSMLLSSLPQIRLHLY